MKNKSKSFKIFSFNKYFLNYRIKELKIRAQKIEALEITKRGNEYLKVNI